MEEFGDLHTHTAHSREADNFLPIRVADYARAKAEMPGLKIVGVVDHDTMNYLEPMHRAQAKYDPSALPVMLPGIEITCGFEHPTRQGKIVQTHLLGYFPRLITYNPDELKYVNSVLEPVMTKAIDGKKKKNVDIRIASLFSNGIIPSGFSFDDIKGRIVQRYEEDVSYVESNEPKEGDIIHWPVISSDKAVTEVLLGLGILSCEEEGKLYVDRTSDKKATRLRRYWLERKGLAKAKHLRKQKCCREAVTETIMMIISS